MASDNFVVVNFVGEKSPDGKPLVDLVPNGWLKVSTGGPMCAYPPPPYDDLSNLIKTSIHPQRSWKYYPAKVLGFAETYVEGSTKLVKALEKLSVSSSECEEVENGRKKFKNSALASLLMDEINNPPTHQPSQGHCIKEIHDSQSRAVKRNDENTPTTPRSQDGSPFQPQTKNFYNGDNDFHESESRSDEHQVIPGTSRSSIGSPCESRTENHRNSEIGETGARKSPEVLAKRRRTENEPNNVSLLARLPCGPNRKYHRTGPLPTTLTDLSDNSTGKRNHSSSDSEYLPPNKKDESSSRSKRRAIRTLGSRKEYSNGGDNSRKEYSNGGDNSRKEYSNRGDNSAFSTSIALQYSSDEDIGNSISMQSTSRCRSSQVLLESKGKERTQKDSSPALDDIDTIQYLRRMEERIDKTMNHVKRSLNHELKKLRASVDELKGTVMLVLKSAGGSVDSNLIVNFEEDLNLPFDDVETFKDFNKNLKDKEKFSTLVNVLSGLYIPSGTDSSLSLTKSVTVLLERYITKNVAVKYSGQGKGRLKKLDFSATRFYRALESAIIKVDAKKNTKDVIRAVSTVLAKAGDWDGGRNARQGKKRPKKNLDAEDEDGAESDSSSSGSEAAVVSETPRDNSDNAE